MVAVSMSWCKTGVWRTPVARVSRHVTMRSCSDKAAVLNYISDLTMGVKLDALLHDKLLYDKETLSIAFKTTI